MRITIINQFYTPDLSPTAHLSASLAEGLAERGHEITVVTSRGGYVDASPVGAAGGENPRVHRVWTPRLGKKSILKRLLDYASFYLGAAWRMVRLRRQDVVISLTTPPYIAWTGWLHRLLHPRVKLVLWNMDCYPDVVERAGMMKKGGILSRIMRFSNRALFRRLDHLICLDQAMVDLLLGQYGPRKRTLPTTIIPNWEKTSAFPAVATGAGQRHPAGQFVLLYSGNMGVGHGFETVIDAAKEMREEAISFVFVGGGKRWQWVKDAKDREGLERVTLRGYVAKEEMPVLLAAADCALITLRDEAVGVMSPSKLHGNLAMGLPVLYVGPKGSNVDEAIERFGCGVSVRNGDVAGMVAFLRRAMADEAERERLSKRAREAFDAAYCDERTLPQFEAILAGLGVKEPTHSGQRAATAPSQE